MVLFFPGIFLLLELFFIHQVDCSGGRIVQFDARQYKEKHGYIKLGDCPTRTLNYPNGTTRIITCPYKYTGDVYFIPLAEAIFDVKRVRKTEDVTSRIGGGITVGAGVGGLISAEVKVSAMVNTQASKKQLSLMSSYRLRRGVMTLRNAKPAGPLPPNYPTELYLSEIVLGGTEILLVNMEFESEKKKTEVEVSVTVKVLWISLTAKMKFITENFKSSAAVEVVRISSWGGIYRKKFLTVDGLQQATKLVEKFENEIKEGPADLLELPLDNETLHTEYHFSSWGRPTEELQFNEALTNAHIEVLRRQIVELQTVINKIDAYLNFAMTKKNVVSEEQITNLRNYKINVADKDEKLKAAYQSYFLMNQKERDEIPDIYGRSKAPFYYTRKLNTIFQPGDDFTYLTLAN